MVSVSHWASHPHPKIYRVPPPGFVHCYNDHYVSLIWVTLNIAVFMVSLTGEPSEWGGDLYSNTARVINSWILLAFFFCFLLNIFLSACSVLLAGDDTGSVWLYDMVSCLSEAKNMDTHDLEQTQVNEKHVIPL